MIIGVACEDDGHFSAATFLVDAALLARHDWLRDIIEHCRSWCGLGPSQPWYKYDPADAYDVRPVVIDGVRIAPSGHIGGKRLEPEAGMWRKVLLLFCHCEPRPDVVLLMRDMDGYLERKKGMEQVRSGLPWPFEIVVAAPEPEIEAWHVAGFKPEDEGEQAALVELCLKLSFRPTLDSHRLTSHPNDAPTDAKRVLSALCGDDPERRLRCFANSALLRERGALNGLGDFLDEIEQRLVPAFQRG